MTVVHAQWGRWGGFREGTLPPRFAPASFPDRDFAFCKLMYDSVRYEELGMGWATDYPYAGINLMIRYSELTTGRVSMDSQKEPNHWVVRLTDDELFNCPFTMAADVGTIGFSSEEVQRLREYLLKGGFLWVDDFWGSRAWQHWTSEIGKVLPPAQYPVVDVPLDHPVFSTLAHVSSVPQITAIQFWYGVGGRTTSERGKDSEEPHFRAITDEHGRFLVVMTHNTDVADAWEREADDPRYFSKFAPDGYGLGINVLLHTMTH
tara:strand:- start:5520 stop:6305 length:786 start_codon:yes stop_codon:yes gene_type:complete